MKRTSPEVVHDNVAVQVLHNSDLTLLVAVILMESGYTHVLRLVQSLACLTIDCSLKYNRDTCLYILDQADVFPHWQLGHSYPVVIADVTPFRHECNPTFEYMNSTHCCFHSVSPQRKAFKEILSTLNIMSLHNTQKPFPPSFLEMMCSNLQIVSGSYASAFALIYHDANNKYCRRLPDNFFNDAHHDHFFISPHLEDLESAQGFFQSSLSPHHSVQTMINCYSPSGLIKPVVSDPKDPVEHQLHNNGQKVEIYSPAAFKIDSLINCYPIHWDLRKYHRRHAMDILLLHIADPEAFVTKARSLNDGGDSNTPTFKSKMFQIFKSYDLSASCFAILTIPTEGQILTPTGQIDVGAKLGCFLYGSIINYYQMMQLKANPTYKPRMWPTPRWDTLVEGRDIYERQGWTYPDTPPSYPY